MKFFNLGLLVSVLWLSTLSASSFAQNISIDDCIAAVDDDCVEIALPSMVPIIAGGADAFIEPTPPYAGYIRGALWDTSLGLGSTTFEYTSIAGVYVYEGVTYMAGSARIEPSSSVSGPAMWVNGVKTNLPVASGNHTFVTGIYVNQNGIHISGYEVFNTPTGQQSTAKLWTNGIESTLPTDIESDTSRAVAIHGSGNDVYVLGTQDNSIFLLANHVVYWKNGVKINVPQSKFFTPSSIFVKHPRVFIAGNNYYELNGRMVGGATVWRGGGKYQYLETPTDYPLEPFRSVTARAVFVDSLYNVYVVGNFRICNLCYGPVPDIRNAVMWVNGVATYLTRGDLTQAEATSVYVHNGLIYVGGYERIRQTGNNGDQLAKIWVGNSTAGMLDIGLESTEFLGMSDGSTAVTSITVKP